MVYGFDYWEGSGKEDYAIPEALERKYHSCCDVQRVEHGTIGLEDSVEAVGGGGDPGY